MSSLHPLSSAIVDGENNPLMYDIAYSVSRGSAVDLLERILHQHGKHCYLLPISAASGGGGIFQQPKPSGGTVIGLRILPPAQPQVRRGKDVDITKIELDQIVIDTARQRVYAGSGITLDQLNKCLAEELADQVRVLGADLTSYSYAQVGATFMTGGMGPQRRYFSSSIDQIALYDGNQLKSIDAELDKYAGTYGWSGLVTAVRCRYSRLPANEVAFAIPVRNEPHYLARLLQHIAPLTQLDTEQYEITTKAGGRSMIFGLEHVTTAAMQPMFDSSGETTVIRRARQLIDKCIAANADGLVFVNGFSDLPIDEFLFELVDDIDSAELSIAGIKLEHTQLFPDPEQMREVREAVPFAARTQAPQGRFSYKGHTDATIRLNPERIETAMEQLWQANVKYVDTVSRLFEDNPKVRGQILVYGHLNPVGVDPHNRVTFASDDKTSFEEVNEQVHRAREVFYQTMQHICQATGSEFIGGEKGAGSEFEMFSAFENGNSLPPTLQRKFLKQRTTIQSALPLFNWRAIGAYRAH